MNVILEPKCGIQPYLRDDIELVKKCGSYEGYKNALLVTLVILILTYFSDGKLDMPHITFEKGLSVIILIIIAWLMIPPITTYSQVQYWRGLKHEIKALRSNRLDDKEIIRHMQGLHQKNLEQSFIRSIRNLIPFI